MQHFMKQLPPRGTSQLVEQVTRRIGKSSAEPQNGLKLLARIQNNRRLRRLTGGLLPGNGLRLSSTHLQSGDPRSDVARSHCTGSFIAETCEHFSSCRVGKCKRRECERS